MIKKLYYLLIISQFGTGISQAQALPDRCLQSPTRILACPHLLYKKSKQAIPTLNVEVNGIVCLCLSDISPLTQPTESPTEKIDQQVSWTEITERYQVSKEDILTLIRD